MDEIRHRLRLSDIIGKRIKLTRAGREYKGCCPFHREKTPSFYVNDDKQFYHCFGCGAHGDHIGFVLRHDNLEFMDAIESLASEAGLQVPKPSPKALEKARKQKHLKTIMEDACSFFEDQLYRPENADVLEYLTKRRGLSLETIASFRLGYAPDHGQDLRGYLKNKGWSDAEMVETALLRPAKKGGAPYAFFRDRVMFPVLDRQGRVVAFGGRILPDDMRPNQNDGDFKPPKYMNSTDTPLFNKGMMLYNESHARQNCGAGQKLIVVEGYADVIALAQAGFGAAVASLGTALTERQIEILWQILPRDEADDSVAPYLCFDGDNAGQRAAMRAVERLLPILKPGKTARFVFMPEGLDPDDLIRSKGPEALEAYLDQSISLVEMLWRMHTQGKKLDAPESRAAIEQRLETAIAGIADRTVQAYYKAQIKDKIWMEFRGGKRFNRNGKAGGSKPAGGGFKGGARNANNPALPPVKLARPGQAISVLKEKIILVTLINHPTLFDDMAEAIGLVDFKVAELRNFKQQVFEVLMSKSELTADELQEELKSLNLNGVLAALQNESVYMHAGFARPGSDFLAAQDGLNDILQREKARKSVVS